MNGGAQVSARSNFFFGPLLTKCRKSAIGLFVFLSVTGVTVAGRWLIASSAEARKIKPGDAPAVSVRVVEIRDEVVASGVRCSRCREGTEQSGTLVPGRRDGRILASGSRTGREDEAHPRRRHPRSR